MKLEIASVRLVNCGPFEDVTLDFRDSSGMPKKTILLAGANGSGKTTALETIAETYYFNFYMRGLNLPGLKERKYKNSYTKIIGYLNGNEIRFESGRRPEGEVDPESHKFNHRDEVKNDLEKLANPLGDVGKDASPPAILYFPHPRTIEPVDPEFLSSEEYSHQHLYRYQNAQTFPGSLSSYLVWLEYSDSAEYDKIIKFLNGSDVDQKKFSVDRKKLQAMVTLHDGSMHRLDQMSSGEQNIFILLISLWKQLSLGSIVMIDEVEGSLHPAYQYKLMFALQKLQEIWDFQLIITSHSVDVLRAIGPGNTLILTDYKRLFKEDGHGTNN